MLGNKVYLFVFICLISLSFSKKEEEESYWTIGNNTISLNYYKSGMNDTLRDNYYYWIGLRNSFYFSEDSNQLEKLVTYFTPEEKDYYKDLFSFSAPGFICSAVVLVIFFIYLVKRFLLKGCRGPKIEMKSYHITTYFFIISGFLVGIISLSLTIYYCGKSK